MNNLQSIALSVVMPAYNEEKAIGDAIREVQQFILDKLPGAELVVVNDGSRDQTGTIIDALAAQDGRIRAIHRGNGGHGPALRTGLDAARGKHVLLIDSDRQIPLDGFARLYHEVLGRDGVFGIRAVRRDPPLRLILTRIVRAALALLFGLRLRDANVPCKLFRRSIWEEARPLIPPNTLAPSLFLAVYMSYRRLDVLECPVAHRQRQTGVVSIRRWRLFLFCLRGFAQLIAFRSKLTARRLEAGDGGRHPKNTGWRRRSDALRTTAKLQNRRPINS